MKQLIRTERGWQLNSLETYTCSTQLDRVQCWDIRIMYH